MLKYHPKSTINAYRSFIFYNPLLYINVLYSLKLEQYPKGRKFSFHMLMYDSRLQNKTSSLANYLASARIVAVLKVQR